MKLTSFSLHPKTILLTAVIAAGVCTARADVTFSDGNFGSPPWSLGTQVTSGSQPSTETATTIASGGNPGSFYRQDTTVPSALGSYRNGIFSLYLNRNANYDPSSGAIQSLDFTIDIIRLTGAPGDNLIAAPGLSQGGKFYAYFPSLASSSSSWTARSVNSVSASSFDELRNDPAGTGAFPPATHPDFGPLGGPMEFGFASGQSTSIGGGGYSIAGGFDNWTVTLHTATVPEPSTWVLLGLGLPALLAFRRRKGA